MPDRVIVIGAGIGGLTAAAELAHSGVDVCLVERAAAPGGKLREILVGGRPVDSGPTVMTMRWVFDEFFAALGTSTSSQFNLVKARQLARHAWDADQTLDLFADLDESISAIQRFAGPDEAQGFVRFSADAERIFRSLDSTFMRAGRTSPLGLCARFGWGGITDLLWLRPYTPMWNVLGEYFRDPRLRQLFGRYAGYCGSSPFLAPSILMLVAHAEREGVWLVEGGMYRIVDALTALLHSAGGQLKLGTDVQQITRRGGRVTGVMLANGEHLDARAVICNADPGALAEGLLGADVRRVVEPIPMAARSMSAITWSLLADVSGVPLIRHNVFFSPDYRAEFGEIFSAGRAPEAPTVYVCAQDRGDAGQRVNAGPERLLMIVNAPADGDFRNIEQGELERCTKRTFEQLAKCGLRVNYQKENSRITTPADFAKMFPGTGGALYGRASHGWMSSFRRPGSRTRISGLYLAGGSTHPGPGVPMAMLSGRQAAASVRADLSSTKR